MKILFSEKKKIELPPAIILIPSPPKGWNFPEEKWLKRKHFINATFYINSDYAVLCNFLGYPHLYLLLEFINIHQTQFYFLGTAGALDPVFQHPALVSIKEVFSSPPLDSLARVSSFLLDSTATAHYPSVNEVSVDIIQRETADWLSLQHKRGISAVDMELFALAAYLQKPFPALLVLTDIVTPQGIQPFADKGKIIELFTQGYEFIQNKIR